LRLGLLHMFVSSQDDRPAPALTAAIDLKPSPTSAGLQAWGTAVAPALATRRIAATCPLALRASFLLAAGIYLLALGGSMVTGISAPLLDGVPLCLGPAAFFWAYWLIAFPRAVRTRLFIEAVFAVVTLGLGLACLSYLGAAAAFPLRDGQMIWVDRHLGFDWLATMLALDHRPIALDILDGAYATFTFQLLATAFVLVLAKRRRDLDRFFVTFVCASLLAEVASVIVPTVGPMSVLAANADFAHLHTLGRTTADIVVRLREGLLREIHLEAVNGIICFPSLHAAVAVIVPFTLRWNKPLFCAVVVLDSAMFVSAVPSGNHYFADVLGGVAVAGVAIAVSGPLQASLARLMRAIVSSVRDIRWARRHSASKTRVTALKAP
jgi:membrane-associated phospholipid phosphatase